MLVMPAPPGRKNRVCSGNSARSLALMSPQDRKSTRLNSSHGYISYAVFCLKKKNNYRRSSPPQLPLPHLLEQLSSHDTATTVRQLLASSIHLLQLLYSIILPTVIDSPSRQS